jgi:hypothetical protein
MPASVRDFYRCFFASLSCFFFFILLGISLRYSNSYRSYVLHKYLRHSTWNEACVPWIWEWSSRPACPHQRSTRASHADRSKNSHPEESLRKQVLEGWKEVFCEELSRFYELVFCSCLFWWGPQHGRSLCLLRTPLFKEILIKIGPSV